MRFWILALVGLVACGVDGGDTQAGDQEPADVGLQWTRVECAGESYASVPRSGAYPLALTCTAQNGGYCSQPSAWTLKDDSVTVGCIAASDAWVEVAWLE